jgi:hypothetical protein
MMTVRRSPGLRAVATAAWLAVVGGTAAGGCGGIKYPACDNDTDCNGDGHKGVCIEHKCVECRDNTNCATGQQCENAACTDIPGFCDPTHACPSGQSCGVDARCHAAEKVAAAPFVECDDTKTCPGGARCENGHCAAPVQGGPGCTDFPSPKFDYEAQDLKGEGRATLERLAQCMTKGTLKGSKVLLTGHCDNRGEQEFNMSLGDYRAEAVKTFLVGLGVSTNDLRTSSRGELDATGTDEAGWSVDRRVDIEVR